MGKCENYHFAEVGGYRYDIAGGKPIPQIRRHGVCIRAGKRCECDGIESRCDYYPDVEESAIDDMRCITCRYWEQDDVCRLKNCHRAFTHAELENKDFVTDAWEKAE